MFLHHRLIDNEQPKIMPRIFGWTSYHTFDEIYEWMDALVETNNETLSHINAGLSHEGRAIRGVKLSHGSVNIVQLFHSPLNTFFLKFFYREENQLLLNQIFMLVNG